MPQACAVFSPVGGIYPMYQQISLISLIRTKDFQVGAVGGIRNKNGLCRYQARAD
jgi:hypothetical protein